MVLMPDQRGELVDTRESPVGVCPTLVREQVHRVDVEVHRPRGEGNSAHDFDAGKAHETEVTIGVEVVVGGQEFLEL